MKKYGKLIMGMLVGIVFVMSLATNGKADGTTQKVNPDNPLSEQIYKVDTVMHKDGKKDKHTVDYYVFCKANANEVGKCFTCDNMKDAEKLARSPKFRKKISNDFEPPRDMDVMNYKYDNVSTLKLWYPDSMDENDEDATISFPRETWPRHTNYSVNDSGWETTETWQRLYIYFKE